MILGGLLLVDSYSGNEGSPADRAGVSVPLGGITVFLMSIA